MRSKTMRSGLLVTALMSSSALASAALAQDGGVALEEVVVTAQKRSENLQDVPISIQALGEAKLEQLQVSGFSDYVKFLPSVSFTGAGPGFNQVYMRGVASGGDGNHSGSLPSVGIYLDEQPITTIQGALDIHVYDIERVESLIGPQGTLYGASSQAGTIRIITNKPSTAGFKAGYDLEVNKVDGGGTGYVAEGFINQPLSDTVAVRLVGWKEREAGYIDNVPATRTYPTSGVTINNAGVAKKNYNEVETYGVRAAMKVDLGENWTVTPQLMGQVQKSGGFFGYDPDIGDLKISHYYPESSDDRWVQASMSVEGKISNLDVVYAGSYLERTVDTEQDYTDYSYFYDTLYGYGAYWTDDAGNPVDPSQYIQGKDRYARVSHELRFSSPQENRFRFVGGLFYQRQEHRIHQDYRIDALGESLTVPGHPDTVWLTEQKRVDRDSAAFGEVSYDITEKLTATAGVRFFKADNSLVGFYGYGAGYGSTGERACFKGAVIAGSPCTNLDKRVKETGNTPKFNLTYKIDSDKLVYATYSEGYRPGGINRRGTLPPYLSDYLKNYELGWKTSWAQNRFRWNGSVYFEKWDKFQFSILGANGLTEIKNAGAADIKGIESDVTWRPTRGLTINASAAYTDAKLSKNYCGYTDSAGNPVTDCASPEAPDGTRLPVTPKVKANVTARYEFDFGDFDAFVQGSLVGQSGNWSDLRLHEREILGYQGGYSTIDLSGGVSRDSWSITAYMTNVADERASQTRFVQCDEDTCADKVYIIPIQPRTFGLKFGQKF
ncbi:TonB-dependent receptor [Caulobacter hibisci]|uniref:TonB-dependent receptor n=1 Tax=Caulobacter hibisci TaxID=2035993 RepID=A0ABS0SWM5_9CAUL|nr:TonB-dependent receptor [Caulobacter hibisci]MBI1684042.1 TonB-dependent receptor [Caulobacter hibisci]